MTFCKFWPTLLLGVGGFGVVVSIVGFVDVVSVVGVFVDVDKLLMKLG